MQPPDGLLPPPLPLRTAVALTVFGSVAKYMLEKIAVCGREIESWTAGSVPPAVSATVVVLVVTLA
jgi:hypothetical protein